MLTFILKCRINILKCIVCYSNLGNIHNSLKTFSSAPKALKRAAVQSPATRMWTLKKSSSGAEVRVKGCHSSCETDGHCRKIYWPGPILKPCFFMWSSRTPEECVTTWTIIRGPVLFSFRRVIVSIRLQVTLQPFLLEFNHKLMQIGMHSNF